MSEACYICQQKYCACDHDLIARMREGWINVEDLNNMLENKRKQLEFPYPPLMLGGSVRIPTAACLHRVQGLQIAQNIIEQMNKRFDNE